SATRIRVRSSGACDARPDRGNAGAPGWRIASKNGVTERGEERGRAAGGHRDTRNERGRGGQTAAPRGLEVSAAPRRLRIAQVAPPIERVPPIGYGGTERIVHGLATELVRRGHEVTTFASADSEVPGRLVPTIERAMRPAGDGGDPSGWFMVTMEALLDRIDDFDIVHSHLEWWSIPLARRMPIPIVSTFHGRLDLPWSDSLLARAREGVVAISRSQASAHPQVPWTIIHNGLPLDAAPFGEQQSEDLCFIGRVDPEKGIIEAIDIALAVGRRLRIAAKIGTLPEQRA